MIVSGGRLYLVAVEKGCKKNLKQKAGFPKGGGWGKAPYL